MPDNTVFLFDVDNTLLDNDAVAADLRAHLTEHFGDERQQFRLAYPHETRMLEMSEWLLEYPFAERVYPKELEVVGQTRAHGRPVTCRTVTSSSSRANGTTRTTRSSWRGIRRRT